jgi:deoxycytidylate deaminase
MGVLKHPAARELSATGRNFSKTFLSTESSVRYAVSHPKETQEAAIRGGLDFAVRASSGEGKAMFSLGEMSAPVPVIGPAKVLDKAGNVINALRDFERLGKRSGNGVAVESRSSREPMGRTVSDQDMIDTLTEKRASSGAPGNATFAMGRAGDGTITPVRESIPGKTREHDIHAEPQVLKDLEDKPKPHTVAVDQQPCADCAQKLLDSDTRVIVPQDINRPKRRPKSSAVKASEGKTQVVPREVDLEDEKH